MQITELVHLAICNLIAALHANLRASLAPLIRQADSLLLISYSDYYTLTTEIHGGDLLMIDAILPNDLTKKSSRAVSRPNHDVFWRPPRI